jgi:DNA-binding MarR family transcriptional regulator
MLQWQRRIVAALKPLGLTHVQFVLPARLWWLTHVAGEEPNRRRVAEHAGTDPMMTSQVLRVLTSKGLVVREMDPSDVRGIKVGRRCRGINTTRVRAPLTLPGEDGRIRLDTAR